MFLGRVSHNCPIGQKVSHKVKVPTSPSPSVDTTSPYTSLPTTPLQCTNAQETEVLSNEPTL